MGTTERRIYQNLNKSIQYTESWRLSCAWGSRCRPHVGHAPGHMEPQSPAAAHGLLARQQQLQPVAGCGVRGQVAEAKPQVWGVSHCACCLRDHVHAVRPHFPRLPSKEPEVGLLELLRPCSAALKDEGIASHGIVCSTPVGSPFGTFFLGCVSDRAQYSRTFPLVHLGCCHKVR